MLSQILQDRQSPPPDLDTCLKMAERIVDPRLGIVKGVYDAPQYPGEASFFQYTAVLSNVDRVLGCTTFSAVAGGASLYRKEAKIKALGEAIEHYCSFIRFEEEMTYASYAELGQLALDPHALPLCSDNEYLNPRNYLARPRRDVKMSWCQGYSLTKQRTLLVPANLVYLSHKYATKDEMISLPISTGLACGASAPEALLSGMCEVVERDAFMVTWYNQLPVPRIDVTEVRDEFIRERLDRLEEAELEPYFFNITTETRIPSILLLLLSKSRTIPVLTATTATHPDPRRALAKVIDEGVSTRKFCVGQLREGHEPKVFESAADVTELEDHLFAYVRPESLKSFDFLLKNPNTVALDDLPNLCGPDLTATLRNTLAALNEEGMEVVAVDITTEDIREVGFTVLRVLIPALEPLSQDHNIRFLGRTRLYEMPKRMGYDSKVRDESQITALPHPFA